MSDSPATQAIGDAQAAADSTLLPRRILAIVISFALGGAVTAAGILILLKAPLFDTVSISFLEVPLLPLAGLPMALFFLIWVDFFMKTKIVVD